MNIVILNGIIFMLGATFGVCLCIMILLGCTEGWK